MLKIKGDLAPNSDIVKSVLTYDLVKYPIN
jgi:hypothetical protein